MALVPMKKVHLLALLEDREAILQKLQRLSMVEIRDAEPADEDALNLLAPMNPDESQSRLEARLAEMDASIKFLSAYSTEKKGFLEQKPVFTYQELIEMQSELEPAEKISRSAKELENRLVEIRSRRIRLQNLKAQIQPWVGLKARLEEVQDTRHAHMALGLVANSSEGPDIYARLEESGCFAAIEKVSEDKEKIALAVLVHKDSLAETLDILKEAGWNEAGLEGLTGCPADILAAYEQEEKELDHKTEITAKEATELSKGLHTLQHARDYYASVLDRLAVNAQLARTGSTFALNGWVMADHTEILEKELSEITNNYFIQFADPEEGDVIPSAVRNKKLFEPFEAVTDMYSPPSPTGVVDPSPLMGFFFVLYFGMMIGDAVYGVMLSIISILIYRWRKPAGTMGKMLRILAWGGLFTAIWGVLLGGVLGLDVKAVLFNPMEEPLLMLGLCFGLGFIHIITGMLVKVYIDIKRKQYVDAICDQVLWIVLIVGLPMLLLPATSTVGTIMSLVGAAGILLTAGRHKKNILKKLTSGLGALYGITSYFSDVLSYARLFALGLATSVIALVFNTLGGMLAGTIVGYVFMVVVLLVGHVFNMGINTLGAFVHSCRLQYIEYFGKFYESGGRKFKPLGCSTRYLRVGEKVKV